MSVGFLLNHSGIHQIAHSLPIANALARLAPEMGIEIFVGNDAVEMEVRRLLDPQARLSVTRLRPATRSARALERLTRGAVPATRLSILRENLDHFRRFDALVVPEKTSLLLKTRFGLDNLKLIHTRHGAGDRAIGFDKDSGRFDLVLLSGPKVRDRLQANDLLKPGGYAMVGYPKFDLFAREPVRRLFDNDRPTVLYNPHPSPALSSWYAMGKQVLEFFAASDRFNLIFAPHVMLFAKRFNISLSPLSFARVEDVPASVINRPHIHIDKGSRASVDMTYSRMADIYLGDASSQVYEFLIEPRPTIFLNPNGLTWQGDENFAHWSAGPVVQNTDELEAALDEAVAQPSSWRERQDALLSQTFDLSDRPSSERAAQAILDFLER